jgi:hypothetical protein
LGPALRVLTSRGVELGHHLRRHEHLQWHPRQPHGMLTNAFQKLHAPYQELADHKTREELQLQACRPSVTPAHVCQFKDEVGPCASIQPPRRKPKPCTEQVTLRPLQTPPPLTILHPISLYIRLHLSAVRHSDQVEKLSAGTRVIQPIALASLSPTPAMAVSEMPTGELQGSMKPNCGGSGCLVSEGYKEAYTSPSR